MFSFFAGCSEQSIIDYSWSVKRKKMRKDTQRSSLKLKVTSSTCLVLSEPRIKNSNDFRFSLTSDKEKKDVKTEVYYLAWKKQVIDSTFSLVGKVFFSFVNVRLILEIPCDWTQSHLFADLENLASLPNPQVHREGQETFWCLFQIFSGCLNCMNLYFGVYYAAEIDSRQATENDRIDKWGMSRLESQTSSSFQSFWSAQGFFWNAGLENRLNVWTRPPPDGNAVFSVESWNEQLFWSRTSQVFRQKKDKKISWLWFKNVWTCVGFFQFSVTVNWIVWLKGHYVRIFVQKQNECLTKHQLNLSRECEKIHLDFFTACHRRLCSQT